MPKSLVDDIVDRVGRSRSLAEDVQRCWRYDPQTVVVDFKVAARSAALEVKVSDDGVALYLIGRGERLSRHFRNVLIGRAPIVTEPNERHLLEQWSAASATARAVVRATGEWIAFLTHGVRSTPNLLHRDQALPADHVSVYWWDRHSNFGDALGPWMVQRLTGRSVVNGRGASADVPTLATAGSIIGHLRRDGVDIWGSGLQRPLRARELEPLRRLHGVRVHAVRGELTRREIVEKVRWDVPEVYGDPALLMPRLYQPQEAAPSQGRVALVAHRHHVAQFHHQGSGEIHWVDVRHSVEQVVDEIAASRACLSTSLHGIVIAQAYGVPWVWLQMEQRALRGGRFKFDDFFTGLDRSRVSAVPVGADGLEGVFLVALAKDASLPERTISLEPLLAAFPLDVAPVPDTGPVRGGSAPRRRWG